MLTTRYIACFATSTQDWKIRCQWHSGNVGDYRFGTQGSISRAAKTKNI